MPSPSVALRYGRITDMPDVRVGPDGAATYAEWEYQQHPRGTLMEDGSLILWSNGGILDVIEDRYLCHYTPDGRPEYARLTGSDDQQGETGMASCCRTPASWPADKRWLLAWSGSYRAEWGRAYRVWIGLATAPAPRGPWTCHPAAIRSQHLVTPGTGGDAWWPPGLWADAVLCAGDRVLVLGHDSGVPFPGPVSRHSVYEVRPDLTSTLVGGIRPSDEKPPAWVRDAAVGADGRLHVLLGDGPHSAAVGTPITEAVTAGPWVPDSVALLTLSGRTWAPMGGLLFDPGWLRTPAGGLVEPPTVFANVGNHNGVARGNWETVYYTEDAGLAAMLARRPATPRLGLPSSLEIMWSAGGTFPPGYRLEVWPAGDCVVTFAGGAALWHPVAAAPGANEVTYYERTGYVIPVPTTAGVAAVRGDCLAVLIAPSGAAVWPRLVQRTDSDNYVRWGG